MPKRIQMSRQRPWRHEHPDAVIVARPSHWGNPFRVYRCDCCGMWDVRDENGVTYLVDHAVARGDAAPSGIILDPNATPRGAAQKREAVEKAVHLYAMDVLHWRTSTPSLDVIRAELAGRDLACWCPLEDERGGRAPCHADVLLDLANAAPVHDYDPVHGGCRRCGALPFDGVPCEPPAPMTVPYPKETDR